MTQLRQKKLKLKAVRVHTLALPPNLGKRLDDLAFRERRTATEIIVEALEEYLKERQKESVTRQNTAK